jgi:hypothetical protein
LAFSKKTKKKKEEEGGPTTKNWMNAFEEWGMDGREGGGEVDVGILSKKLFLRLFLFLAFRLSGRAILGANKNKTSRKGKAAQISLSLSLALKPTP